MNFMKTGKYMKAIKTMLMGCIAAMMMTACDSDSSRSEVLFGEWEGNWGMYYEYEYRGRVYIFNSYMSDVVFYPDHRYATWGDGYQVDWYSEGPYSRISMYFKWEVRNAIIYLTYPGYPEYNADIYDYYLDDYRFRGRFSHSSDMFNMRRLSFYDWAPYYGYDYYYWTYDPWVWDGYNGYYYSRATDSNAKESEGRIIKIGNRNKN